MVSNEQKIHKVIVIGAGQAGLAVGYYLQKYNIPFLILDANNRVGDAWRNRWDSLRLFTHAKFDGLPGKPFQGNPNSLPTKDEMADYLELYSDHFKLPVRNNSRVDLLTKEDNLFFLKVGDNSFQAENVVIAMSNFQDPKIPEFAKELNPNINQFHSHNYREPSQFKEGGVLVVGAGNSGAEIALEAAKNNHEVWLSGRDTGHIPFDIQGILAKVILERLIIRFIFHRVFTTNTPIGRKVRPKVISHGGPLIKVKPKEFIVANIKRVPKVIGVDSGYPVIEGQKTLDVKNIVWCTGFKTEFSWIDIPNFINNDMKLNRGIAEDESGLFFVGQHFLYAFSSAMIHGVGRDAKYVVDKIVRRFSDEDVK